MDLGVLLEFSQGSQSSSRVGACTFPFLPSCSSSVRFPSRGTGDLWHSLEPFTRGFPTRLSHRAVPLATVVGVDPRLKVEEVQGEEFSLEWTETSGGLWEWCHDPGIPLAFLVESGSS